jgi:radical SAM protein with 4Fe4S-binding SPASM domain
MRKATRNSAVAVISAANKIIKSNSVLERLTLQALSILPYQWIPPNRVSFELTNICNLHCPLCPTTNVMKRKKGMMTLEDFKVIARKLKEAGVKQLDMNYAGEMTLNPNIFKMIKYANSLGLKSEVSTNGTSAKTRELIEAEPTSILFAMDGITKKTQEAYRRNSKFEDVYKHLKELCYYKKKLNTKTMIIWQFIPMKHNEHEIKDVIRIAKEIGVDRLDLKTASLFDEILGKDKKTLAEKFLPKNKTYTRYSAEQTINKPIFCPAIYMPLILYNGDVTLCCYDYDGKYSFGNILTENSFKKIWKSQRLKKIRRSIIKLTLPLCQKCTMGVGGSIIFRF